MSTETFYSDLTSLNKFSDITKAANFVSAPDDWYIIITDIIESTKAIEQGRYKDVNLLGASSIIAVLNIAEAIDIPYVFGGDGASILIPPILYATAKQALLSIQQLAKTEFDLNLRVGIVPISVVVDANYAVKIARMKVSEHYSQAVIRGGGLTYATQLVKAPGDDNLYCLIPSEAFLSVDLSGLECRWQDLPSLHEEILSLIVLETEQATRNSFNVYQDVIDKIEKIYGSDPSYHPVSDKNTNFTFQTKALVKETKLRVKTRRFLDKMLYLWKIKAANLLGLIFMRFKLKFGDMDWGAYKTILTNATDYRKFDDMLRMVMSGTVAQREALVHYLEDQYIAGNLVYGTHVSDRALMTCLVFEYNGPQVHFIDGADGGYTLAAKAMKARMHRKALNWKAYLALNKQRHLFR